MLRKCKHYKHCLLFKNYNLCVGRINRQSFSNLYKHFVIKIRKLSIILMARNKVENCLHVTRLSIIYLLNTRWHGVWAWCRKAVIHFFFFSIYAIFNIPMYLLAYCVSYFGIAYVGPKTRGIPLGSASWKETRIPPQLFDILRLKCCIKVDFG